MEVAQLEATYVADDRDFQKKSANVDSRLKQTATQARQTEKAVRDAYKSASTADPLAALKAEFGGRSAKLKSEMEDIATRSKALKLPLKDLESQAVRTGIALRKDLDGALGILSPRLTSVTSAVGPLTAGLLGIGAIIAGGVGIFQLTKHAAEAGDEIFDLTQKVNFSAESISTLKNEGKLAGVEFGTISGALGIFNKNLEAVNQGDKALSRTFKALKIDIRDNETALRSAFRALMAVEDGGQQSALAMKIFGKSGKEVLGVIKSLNGDIDAATEKFRAMGSLITTESARAANEFSDKLALLEQKFDSVARAVGERFMPTVSRAMDDVNAALDKNKATAQNWATDLVSIMEFAATQVGHILEGLALVVEGFRKTFGKGSIVGDAIEGETKRRLLSLPDGRVMDLNSRETFDVNTEEGKAKLFGQPQRWDVEGEWAIPFASTPDKPKTRIPIPGGGGGGGGAKTQRDILEALKGVVVSLNEEYRKYDVALLNSASASDLLSEKERVLSAVLHGLKPTIRAQISDIRDIDEAFTKALSSLPAKSQATARALLDQALSQIKLNQQTKVAGELNKQAEELSQRWRAEMDRARGGVDDYAAAIEDLEKAYSKHGQVLDTTTRKELEQLAVMQRELQLVLAITRARSVMDITRERFQTKGGRNRAPWTDLGGGSTVGGESSTTSRPRIATPDEQARREREEMRVQQMQEVAQDLGSIFSDVFNDIGQGWDRMWENMLHTAQNIASRVINDIFTGLFERAFNVPQGQRSGGISGLISGHLPLVGGLFSKPKAGGTGSGLAGAINNLPVEAAPHNLPKRAFGGPVLGGISYIVGDHPTGRPNPEIFTPSRDGYITPVSEAVRSALGQVDFNGGSREPNTYILALGDKQFREAMEEYGSTAYGKRAKVMQFKRDKKTIYRR